MNSHISPPPFRTTDILAQVKDLHDGYFQAVGEHTRLLGINFDHIYEQYIYPTYEIELVEDLALGDDETGQKIWGYYDFLKNVAFVDQALKKGDPRRTFTCWHEVGGHGVLQGDWLRRRYAVHTLADTRLVTTEDCFSSSSISTLEIQANTFAAYAAAPDWLISHALTIMMEIERPIRYIGPGMYSLVVRGETFQRRVNSFDELCRAIAYFVQRWFGSLSLESLGYRIGESGLVRDVSRERDLSSNHLLYRRRKTNTIANTSARGVIDIGSILQPH